MDEAALCRLMTWLSSSFPVGAYSYSHGIEAAVEEGLVRDRPQLERWIGAIVRHGTGRLDAVFLSAAWHAVRAGNDGRLKQVAEHATAYRGTAELALESTAQGRAFLDAVDAAWPELQLAALARILEQPAIPPVHPVAVGMATAAAGMPLRLVVPAYLQAFAANLVSAGVRLIPLGQTDGLKALAALEPVIQGVAETTREMTMDDIGTATLMVDWSSIRHETQYVRLFRS